MRVAVPIDVSYLSGVCLSHHLFDGWEMDRLLIGENWFGQADVHGAVGF
jgi:hypothetical protein